jgi:hypothetical protein
MSRKVFRPITEAWPGSGIGMCRTDLEILAADTCHISAENWVGD